MGRESNDSIGHAFNAKVVITSVAVLLVACFIIVLFHLIARWFSYREALQRNLQRRQPNVSITTAVGTRGLDVGAMNSLPTFMHESGSHAGSPVECAVCLSEFQDSEAGRILPGCRHCFHVDCIDTWLRSHGSCPLCRTQVEVQPITDLVGPVEDQHETVVSIPVTEDTGSGSCPAGLSDRIHVGCSSSSWTVDVAEHLTIPTGLQDSTIHELAPDSDASPSSDFGSGPKPYVGSGRVFYRCFSV